MLIGGKTIHCGISGSQHRWETGPSVHKIPGEPGAVRPRINCSANRQVVDTRVCSRDFVNRPFVDGNASAVFCTEAIGIDSTPVFGKVASCHLFFRPKRDDCADIAHQWTTPIKRSITAEGYFRACSDNSTCGRNAKSADAVWGLKGRPFRPSGTLNSVKPGPKGPGWKNGWPAWAGRRRHPPCVKSSSPDWLDPVKLGV